MVELSNKKCGDAMKIGITQTVNSLSLGDDIQQISDAVDEAYSEDVDLLCFSEWFIGYKSVTEMSSLLTTQLSSIAKRNILAIVTGNILISSGLKVNRHTSLVINVRGEIMGSQDKIRLYKEEVGWVKPATGLELIRTKYGDLCILSGLTSLDVDSHKQARDLGADIIVLQYSFKTLEERNEVRDVLLPLSEMTVPLIVVAPFVGVLNKTSYVAPGFIIYKGELITQGEEGSELITGEVDIKPRIDFSYY